MSELTLDLRHSLRGLVKSPTFSLGVVVILALGLGANMMILSVFDNVLLRPMGFAEPDRLSFVWPERAWFTKRELVAFREASLSMLIALGFVAMVAVFVPAWRASRVDPLVALRYE